MLSASFIPYKLSRGHSQERYPKSHTDCVQENIVLSPQGAQQALTAGVGGEGCVNSALWGRGASQALTTKGRGPACVA